MPTVGHRIAAPSPLRDHRRETASAECRDHRGRNNAGPGITEMLAIVFCAATGVFVTAGPAGAVTF
jgi:hypothetical protein